MEHHLELPEALRRRILATVDASIAFNTRIGSSGISIDGVVVFQDAEMRSILDKLAELRVLVGEPTILQS